MSQCMEALAIAESARLAQAGVIRTIREGGAEVAIDVLTDPDETAAAIRLKRVLGAIPRYGHRRIARLLTDVGVPPARLDRRLRELTERERQVIADELWTAIERKAARGNA